MDRGKILAIVTGAISILIAIAYLAMVQLPPISQLSVTNHQIAVIRD